MRQHKHLDDLMNRAEMDGRCCSASSPAERQAMLRRTRCGDVVRPFRSVYARREYWDGLNPIEQASHVIREMARRHPERVFAGLSAAVIYGFEHSWTLHDEPYVYIATDGFTKSRRSYHRLRRISVRRSDIREDCRVVRLYRPRGDGAAQDGSNTWSQVSKLADRIAHERALRDNVCIGEVRVTSPARTLVDCALLYPFEHVLSMFDSALRRGLVTREEIVAVCDGLRVDCGPVFRLLHYADARSENGGESFCRAVSIEEGFVPPQLQHTFYSRVTGKEAGRVDFIWHTEDGRIIVLEFDGMQKYIDPEMTSNRDVRQVVRDERQREQDLKEAGVSVVIRTNYNEVVQRAPFIMKLMQAGVPRAGAHPIFEHAD
ncbi:CTP synthase [Bifidobacterium bifidum]|nr:CTP synthase [Bifidobacterium bifidum]MDB1224032.1 CTP synthase [Bifidobacterium bifidum]